MVETEMVMPGLANVNWYRVATTIMNRAEVKILKLSKKEMMEDELRNLVDPEGVRQFLDVVKEKETEEIYFWWKGRWVKHNDLSGKMENIVTKGELLPDLTKNQFLEELLEELK